MEMLFKLAGLAMCTNVLCSLVLLAKLHNDPLAGELFALPNAWLGPRPRWLGIRLPWVPSPRGLSESSLGTRAVFFLARMSGVAFPIAILAFLASSFILAGR
jgi:hypothetical protein